MINHFSIANARQDFLFDTLLVERDQHPDRLADSLIGREAKDSFGAFVPTRDGASETLADSCVTGGFNDSGEFGLRHFGSFALDKLADLATDAIEHLQKALIGLPQLAAEAFDNGDDFISQLEGKTQCAMEIVDACRRSSWEIVVLDDVTNPNRFARGPDAARQTESWFKFRFASGGFELGKSLAGDMPEFDAGEFVGGGLDIPNGA